MFYNEYAWVGTRLGKYARVILGFFRVGGGVDVVFNAVI